MNRHLEAALDQALILRCSRDFDDVADWRRFIDQIVGRRNRRREASSPVATAIDRSSGSIEGRGRPEGPVRVEAAALRPLPVRRTTDFTETVVRVTRTGGFLVHEPSSTAPPRA